jgi:hypothetical protein
MTFTLSGEEVRQIKNYSSPHRLYNREHSDTNNTSRQIKRKLHLTNQMYRLPIEIHEQRERAFITICNEQLLAIRNSNGATAENNIR